VTFHDFFDSAKYIAACGGYRFPYIRKEFFAGRAKKIKRARLYVSALGFCELYLNGKKITDDLFISPLSQYNRQTPEGVGAPVSYDDYFFDELGYTVYVSVFDVKRFIGKGKNALGIILAGGWYRSDYDKHKLMRNYGDTRVCFKLVIERESGEREIIISDKDCVWKESFLLRAGIFHEEHDERLELFDFSLPDFDWQSWQNAEEKDPPAAEYLVNECPPDRLIKYLSPKLISDNGREKIYDCGENITGFPVIEGKSSAGDRITCIHSEVLEEDNTLNEFHSYDQNSVFISDGRKEHSIRFTWHGFRYFSIATDGDLSALTCKKVALVYADIKNTSRFTCNDDTVNFIYDAYIRSQAENFHCGVPCDCPQIEKKGYTGDGQLLAPLGMLLFDSRKLYKKWLGDISDAQDRKSGFVHYTAPVFVGAGGGPGGWSAAIINVPYEYYRKYGDKEILHSLYPQMKKYVEFMDSAIVDGLINMTNRNNRCLGDWSGPQKPFLPEPFVNSCLYASALMNMTDIAKIIGSADDIPVLESRIKQIKKAIDGNYFDGAMGDYCGNEQGSNAFAVNIGLGNEKTLQNLANRYRELKGFDTGIFGTSVLAKVLFEKGYGDIAVSLYTSKNPVSFYSWRQEGATTLYESWSDARSLNHPMFGSVVLYLFEYLLGIRQRSPGYRSVVINPKPCGEISEAKGRIQTAAGRFFVSFNKKGKKDVFVVKIPKGVLADFEYSNIKFCLKTGKNRIKLPKTGEN
jgi:alpha-L-rhamnosidase